MGSSCEVRMLRLSEEHRCCLRLHVHSLDLDELEQLLREASPWHVQPMYKNAAFRMKAKRLRRTLYNRRGTILHACFPEPTALPLLGL